MILTLIQMTLIMACGACWRFVSPAEITAVQTRKVLTTLVYIVFLPALVLNVLWTADMGLHSLEFTLLGVSGILLTQILVLSVCHFLNFGRHQMGAVLLAASFPNVIYLGLPVLEQTFGSWSSSVAVQLNFFAVSPLVYTVGVLIAQHYGGEEKKEKSKGINCEMFSFLKTPPFIAVFIAIFLNYNDIPSPLWLTGVLKQLSNAVVPLMLFSLGLALSWNTFRLINLPYIIPIVIFKLFFMPLLAIETVSYLTMPEQHKAAVVLEMAMPSMVVGIIFCDQYGLDSELYAMAVTITTLLSVLSLPFWYGLL